MVGRTNSTFILPLGQICKSACLSYADYYYTVDFSYLITYFGVLENDCRSTTHSWYLSLSTRVAVRELGLQGRLFWCTCYQMERGKHLKNIFIES